MRTFASFLISLYILLLTACQPQPDSGLTVLIDEIRQEYAPDKRVALFTVDTKQQGDQLVLSGETTLAEAHKALITALQEKSISFKDEISILPDNSVGDKPYALINNSVANIRSAPKHSAELATQALLGHPVRILKHSGDFYLIQTPDGYISWVDHGGIHPISSKELEAYQGAEKIIYTQGFGYARSAADLASLPIADLAIGNVLSLTGQQADFYQVNFPDGREAYVAKGEASPLENWFTTLKPSTDGLLAQAQQLIGAPYLWGGTSSKGMDCSGFTKTVYLMQGFILPRDASQQIHSGQLVDKEGDFSKLQVGDLLFFGRPATDSTSERATHVGMWLGDNQFIHASRYVRLSSVDPNAPNYDEFNTNRYLRSKRMLLDEPVGISPLLGDYWFSLN